MYNYIQNQFKLPRFKLSHFLFTILSFALLTIEAHATGLAKAKGILEIIKGEILTIVPVIAVVALIGLGIGYAMGSVQKETFVKWVVGLVIVGSATSITQMLLG